MLGLGPARDGFWSNKGVKPGRAKLGGAKSVRSSSEGVAAYYAHPECKLRLRLSR